MKRETSTTDNKKEKVEFDAMTNMVFPMPTVILGTMLDGVPNFMRLGWIVRANFSPSIIAIGLGKIPKPHHTNVGINQSQTFSLNYPGVDLIEKLDYCGTVSGEHVDKSEVFDLFYGKLTTAPMVRECSVTMECKVVNVVEMETTDLVFGEVIGAYADESVLSDGKIDVKKLNPFLWTSPDEQYWALGEKLGDQGVIGKDFKP